MKDAFRLLNGNLFKILGIVVLCYFIKLVAETLPVQGSVFIEMNPVSVASTNNFQYLILASIVNSILFFVMIDYIINTQHTMRKRFVHACTYPFRHWRLLYKGLIIFFCLYLLVSTMGMMVIYGGFIGLAFLAAEINVWTISVSTAYILMFLIFIWLFLGISQAPYILYDNPSAGVFKSIKESFSLMKGYKWSLIGLLILSAISMIVGALIFIIGAVVSIVLFELVRLTFYQELLRKKRQREWHAKVEDAYQTQQS